MDNLCTRWLRWADPGTIASMFRVLPAALAAATLLLAGPGAAAAEDAPDTLTPDGPATVSSVWRGAVTTEGRGPEVLTGVRVTVGPGGRGGPIRLRVSSHLDPDRGTQLGPWVDLPAEPGVYRFPAPALRWDYRDGVIAIDQQVGGHAIVRKSACTPEQGQYGDVCQIVSLDVFHGLADGDSGAGTDTTPPERVPGQQLAVTGVFTGDRDRDRVPDAEDRTDLRLTATRTFAADGSSTIRATIVNAGPRTADLPILAIDTALRREAWTPACRVEEPAPGFGGSFPLGVQGWDTISWCPLAALAPGASVTLSGPLSSALANERVAVNASGDGEDLVPADNLVKLAAQPPVEGRPAVVLRTPARQRIGRRGLRVAVQTRQAGSLRVTVRIGALRSVRVVRVGAGSHRHTLTFRPRLRGTRAHTATITARFTARDGTVSRTSSRMAISR